jgi:hypothetical protein
LLLHLQPQFVWARDLIEGFKRIFAELLAVSGDVR